MLLSRLTHIRVVFATLLGALAGALTLHAQTSTDAAPLVLPDYPVLGSPEAIFTLPGAAHYADLELASPVARGNLNALMRELPGVYLREEDGFGLFPNIGLRGVDISRSAKVTLLEDGVLTAPAPYASPSAYYAPTVARMEGLEVLMGSSQVRFGPHTTGGVINYRSRQITAEPTGEAVFTFGTDHDRRLQLWGSTTGALADRPLGVLGQLYYRENDGFKTIDAVGDYAGSDDTGFRLTDYLGKVRLDLDEEGAHWVELRASYADLEANEGYLGLSDADFDDNPYRRYAASRVDLMDREQRRLHLQHYLELSDDQVLHTSVYWQDFGRNWYKLHDIRDIVLDNEPEHRGVGVGGAPIRMGLSEALAGAGDGIGLEVLKAERAGDLRVRANNRDYELYGIQSEWRAAFDQGDLSHRVEVGARYHVDNIRRFQWHDLYRQDAEGNWAAPVRSVPGSDGNRFQETTALALYARDEITFGAWRVLPGLRYEWLDMTYTDYTTDGTNQPVTTEDGDMGVWAGGVSVSRRLDANWLVFGGVHRGFSVPGPRAHLRSGIDEETSTAFEAGLRFGGERSLTGELVAFRTSFDDLIVIDNIGGAGTGDTENVGSVLSQGLELLLRSDLMGDRPSELRLPVTLTVTYTDATLDGDASSTDAESIFAGGTDGDRVPYLPEWQTRLSIGFVQGAFEGDLGITWVDDTWTSASATAANVNPVTGDPDARFGRIDSYHLVDAHFAWNWREGVRFFVAAENLLDEEYVVSRHPHGPRPGAPRLFSAGMRLSF